MSDAAWIEAESGKAMTHRLLMACSLILLAMTALSAQAPAAGDAFYKCVSAAGAVSYQQSPCSGKDRTAWSRSLPAASSTPTRTVPQTPAEVVREHQAHQAERQAALAKQAAATAAAKPVKDTRSPQQKRCDEATLARDAWERQTGPVQDLERLRTLNNDIFEACKGL
jgi:hypothetical protein